MRSVLPLYRGEVLFAELGVWLHGFLPRLPTSRANFIRIVLNVLQGLQDPTQAKKRSDKKQLENVTGNTTTNFSDIRQILETKSSHFYLGLDEYVYLERSLSLIHTTANGKIVNGGVLNDTFLVNNEKSSQCNSLSQ